MMFLMFELLLVFPVLKGNGVGGRIEKGKIENFHFRLAVFYPRVFLGKTFDQSLCGTERISSTDMRQQQQPCL